MPKLSVTSSLKKARAHIKRGEIREAENLYQGILATYPGNKDARLGLAAIGNKLRQGDSLASIDEAIRLLIGLYNEAKYAEIIQVGQTLIEQFPTAYMLWNILGVANQALGRIEAAQKAFERVTILNAGFADGFNNLGVIRKLQGDMEGAIAEYVKAITLNPAYSVALYNLGAAEQQRGHFEESVEAFNKAILIDPEYLDPHIGLGIAFRALGELEDAKQACKKALLLGPNNPAIHNNLGNVYLDIGEIDKAILAYKDAILLQPEFAIAHDNLGNAYRGKGDFQQALIEHNRAIELQPDYADAYNNSGVTLWKLGKRDEAIRELLTAISLRSDYIDAYRNLGNVLKGVTFVEPYPPLEMAISSILRQKTLARPSELFSSSIGLLRADPKVRHLIDEQSRGNLGNTIKEILLELSEIPLLLDLMSVCPFADIDFERAFKAIRSYLLTHELSDGENTDFLVFKSALALQCFTNEYIYEVSPADEAALHELECLVEKRIESGGKPSPSAVLCLASFRPLSHYSWHEKIVPVDDIAEVFARQVCEPREESRIKPRIPSLRVVADKISLKVRKQYEERPYPRWMHLRLPQKSKSIAKVVDEIQLTLGNTSILNVKSPKILIAGCGTGQHSIETAKRFENSQIVAIDLSKASLAYAKRKTAELGLQNIEYIQGDILDLADLEGRFDIIECSGVLHHMADPMRGWALLEKSLNVGGLMGIGLYSTWARQHIIRMRKEISQFGIGSDDSDMKAYRNRIMLSDLDHHKSVTNSIDFYSLSTLRDLLFHEQEHTFTIPKIQECLTELRLKFCGFENDLAREKFGSLYPNKEDQYDLEKWNDFELSNPSTFAEMYQFWCQKEF